MEQKYKGSFMSAEGILLVCVFVLAVLAALAYIKRDEGAAKQFNEAVGNMQGSITELQNTLNEIREENKNLRNEVVAVKTVSDSMFADHGKRLSEIENKKPLTQLQDVNLRFKDPLQVSIIYKEAGKKVAIPPQVSGKKSPLLDRAGITN